MVSTTIDSVAVPDDCPTFCTYSWPLVVVPSANATTSCWVPATAGSADTSTLALLESTLTVSPPAGAGPGNVRFTGV